MIEVFQKFILQNYSTLEEIEINPTYELAKSIALQRQKYRTIGAKQNIYQIEGFKQYNFTIPLTFLNESDKNKIEDWWRDQDKLWFFLGEEGSLTGYLCLIVNQNSPFPNFSFIQESSFNGVLFLKSIEPSIYTYPIARWDSVNWDSKYYL